MDNYIKKINEYDNKNIENNFNNVFHCDCIELMKKIPQMSVDLVLTDIPYEKVDKKSNGLRVLDKGMANKKTFSIPSFLRQVYRITKGSGYIFCGKEQVSEIFKYFDKQKVTTRLMIWEKNNPSPMNCQHVWMSGIECFIYFKKRGAVFNEFYKNSVLRFPNGISKIHPTQKPIKLFEYLIKTSSNVGDLVFDPCLGSGTSFFASKNTKRSFFGCELIKEYCDGINQKILEENNKHKKFKDVKEYAKI